MNIFVITVGLIELCLSLILSVFILYLTFKFFHFMTKDIDDIKELKKNNQSIALYNGATLFSVAWVVKSSIQGAISAITLLLWNPAADLTMITKTTGVIVLQIFIAIFIGFFGVYIGTRLFTGLTRKIDEFKEIKNNNHSIAIILSVIIVIIAIYIEPSVHDIAEGLVPYPTVLKTPALAG